MNSKTVLALVAAVIIVGGVLAVRNLTTTDDKIEIVGADEAETTSDDIGLVGSVSDNADDVKIKSIDKRSGSSESNSGRQFKPGEGATNLKVTPATNRMQTAMPVDTPQTTVTEESKDEGRQIADLVNMFRSQSDPDARVDIADDLGMIDSPVAIQRVLELLKEEKDPMVRVALLEAMQGLDALETSSDDVYKEVAALYPGMTDSDERIAAQDLMGDIATPAAADALRNVISTSKDPADILNATENLMRINAMEPGTVTPEEGQTLTATLKDSYKNAPDTALRQQAIMALAIDGKQNVPFFREAIQTEEDSDLKMLLERVIRMYNQPAPQAPPAGTVVTPVPTPDVQ